jgi:dihydroxyacid dehydratase/phosphogluconate dehydratase
VLHFLAIAHAAEVEWTIDDFERVRRKSPVICDLKPSGKYLAVDLHEAGGIPQVMKLLLNAGPAARRLHHHHRPDHRRSAEGRAGHAAQDQDVIRPSTSRCTAKATWRS